MLAVVLFRPIPRMQGHGLDMRIACNATCRVRCKTCGHMHSVIACAGMCGRCGPICLQYDMSHAAILAHSRMPHAANLAHPFLVDCSLQTMFLAQAQDNYIDAALTTTLQVGGIAC